jgi:hypothetical protein
MWPDETRFPSVKIGFAWPMASGRQQYFVSTNIFAITAGGGSDSSALRIGAGLSAQVARAWRSPDAMMCKFVLLTLTAVTLSACVVEPGCVQPPRMHPVYLSR